MLLNHTVGIVYHKFLILTNVSKQKYGICQIYATASCVHIVYVEGELLLTFYGIKNKLDCCKILLTLQSRRIIRLKLGIILHKMFIEKYHVLDTAKQYHKNYEFQNIIFFVHSSIFNNYIYLHMTNQVMPFNGARRIRFYVQNFYKIRG